MPSYLTEPEWAAVFEHFGVRDTLAYAGVSDTIFSPARMFGALTINGALYLYSPSTDELLRQDVIKWVERRRADAILAQRNAQAEAARAAQLEIADGKP